MDTAGGYGDTGAAVNGQTTSAAGTYDQGARGGHNWGWIGLFGLLGLLGMRGRNRTTLEDRTTAERPYVNTRP
jgi:hypothetical protein